MNRVIDGVARSFVRPQFLTVVASGNVATLTSTLDRFASMASSDDIIGHSLAVNYTLAAKAGALGGAEFAITVGSDAPTLGLVSGFGGLSGVASRGNASVVAEGRLLAPIGTVSDLAVSGNQVIDLNKGYFPASTIWCVYLAGNAGQDFTVSVSATLVYNSARELGVKR